MKKYVKAANAVTMKILLEKDEKAAILNAGLEEVTKIAPVSGSCDIFETSIEMNGTVKIDNKVVLDEDGEPYNLLEDVSFVAKTMLNKEPRRTFAFDTVDGFKRTIGISVNTYAPKPELRCKITVEPDENAVAVDENVIEGMTFE